MMTDSEQQSRHVPWQRQPRETDRAWEAFQVWLNLGPGRSLHEAARRLGKPVSQVHVWSQKWTWIGRAAAWDSRLNYAEAEAAEKNAVKQVEAEAAKRPVVIAAWRKILRLETRKWLALAVTSEKPIMAPEKMAAVVDTIERSLSGQAATAEDTETAAAVERLLTQLRRVRERTAPKAE